MNDGVPSEEQRRRIERGVLDRIDARRRLARGIAGGAVAVALLAGGIGVVARGSIGSSGSTAGSGSAAGGSASGSAARTVTCTIGVGSDAGGSRVVTVPVNGLPAAAIRACGADATEALSGLGASGTAGGTDSGSSADSPPPSSAASAAPTRTGIAAALCVDVDGGLIVIARAGTPAQTCTRAGLTPFAP